jgi:hypothetical protein
MRSRCPQLVSPMGTEAPWSGRPDWAAPCPRPGDRRSGREHGRGQGARGARGGGGVEDGEGVRRCGRCLAIARRIDCDRVELVAPVPGAEGHRDRRVGRGRDHRPGGPRSARSRSGGSGRPASCPTAGSPTSRTRGSDPRSAPPCGTTSVSTSHPSLTGRPQSSRDGHVPAESEASRVSAPPSAEHGIGSRSSSLKWRLTRCESRCGSRCESRHRRDPRRASSGGDSCDGTHAVQSTIGSAAGPRRSCLALTGGTEAVAHEDLNGHRPRLRLAARSHPDVPGSWRLRS